MRYSKVSIYDIETQPKLSSFLFRGVNGNSKEENNKFDNNGRKKARTEKRWMQWVE